MYVHIRRLVSMASNVLNSITKWSRTHGYVYIRRPKFKFIRHSNGEVPVLLCYRGGARPLENQKWRQQCIFATYRWTGRIFWGGGEYKHLGGKSGTILRCKLIPSPASCRQIDALPLSVVDSILFGRISEMFSSMSAYVYWLMAEAV